MSYLATHRDTVLGALKVLTLERGESWATTAWVRSPADAESLRASLASAAAEAAGSGRLSVSVELALDDEGRDGVHVAVCA